MKILVGTDGSNPALKAVKYAARLAGGTRAASVITLVSVHDDTALRHAEHFVGRQAVEDYLRALSDKDLARARRHLDQAGIRHDMVIRTGHVASEIVALANRGKFDLVVVGSKGRSALGDLLVGSVAQRVAALAKVPVLIVK
jgi:nucleotide-binding universal stress UspA family protein